ncbi:hypothetical protein N9L94_00760 [Robiginitalea sp.]|nr:hypothetical protein [Robiginitalea sp.]
MNFRFSIGILSSLFLVLLSFSCSPEDGLDGANGRDGLNGADGQDGSNGLSSLVDISIEPIGDNCPTGGYLIESGLDANSNNTLDANEVSSAEYLCNSSNYDAPYQSYVALISQSGTADPISVVLENSADISISWTRTSQGVYLGQLSQAIDIGKAVIFYSTPASHTGVRGELLGSDQIQLELQYGVNFFLDNFENLSFELRLYE